MRRGIQDAVFPGIVCPGQTMSEGLHLLAAPSEGSGRTMGLATAMALLVMHPNVHGPSSACIAQASPPKLTITEPPPPA